MREQYASRRVSLNAPISSSGLQPWEDVNEQVKSLARSYYERDLAFTRNFFLARVEEGKSFFAQYGVPEDRQEEVLSGLQIELADIDSELESLSNQYVAMMDSAMSQVLSEEPEKYPLVDLRDTSSTSGGGTLSIQVEQGGWYVVYRCRYSDFPRLSELQKEREMLVGQRNARLRAFIENVTADR